MNILFIAAECAPFAKVGGLGDVLGALPAALAAMGHSVRVVLPHHGNINDEAFGLKPAARFPMNWNEDTTQVVVSSTIHRQVAHFFIRGYPFFSPDEKFIYHQDEGIDVGRYLFLSAAALELVHIWDEQDGWTPDVYHVHDWHTAFIPYLLTRKYGSEPGLEKAPTVFSIHNLRYQGWGLGWHLERAGLPPVDHGLLHATNRADNSLAVGLAYSTMLSTVSPRYAMEINSLAGGFGLDGILSARQTRLVGILNGIDTALWDPSTSSVITRPFSVDTLSGRQANKLALQSELGIRQDKQVPLIGAVMRLVEQKGPGILASAMRIILTHRDCQFVLLGNGQYEYENLMRWLGYDFPTKASVALGFDESLAERIYAAADFFVMPSLFEPCGIGQMIAMRYGAVPVVRAVGGLVDTVPPEIGFLFHDFHPGALEWALNQALDTYQYRNQEWISRQQSAMRMDHSWERSACRYIDLYEQAIAIRRMYE